MFNKIIFILHMYIHTYIYIYIYIYIYLYHIMYKTIQTNNIKVCILNKDDI